MDYENSKDYTLSIRLMPDGFSFSVHNINVEQSFEYQRISLPRGSNYLPALEEAILHHEQLLYPYRQVNIIVATTRFTFVPEALYDDAHRTLYYDYNLGSRKEVLLSNLLKQNHLYNIYGLSEDVHAFLCRTFINCTFFHHLSILNEYFITKSRMGNCAKMICQFREQMLDILCFSKGKLILANSFEVTHLSDAVYFILCTWQRVHFDTRNDELQFTGEGIQELTVLLNPYIARIIPMVFPAQMFNLGDQSLTAPFDIIALPLCV